MRHKGMGSLVLSVAFILVAVTSGRGADVAASAPAAAAASRPAKDIVLARVGPWSITQEEFNREAGPSTPEEVAPIKAALLQALVNHRLAVLWFKAHPEVVSKETLDATLADVFKKEKVKNRAELDAKLKADGREWQLRDYLDKQLTLLGRAALVSKAQKRCKDESFLRKMFDEDPSAFDGSRVHVRHIVIFTKPWDTPEQLKAKRDKLIQIREDILSGRRTWEQCVDESDDGSTRMIAGDLGMVPRHLERPEPLAKAAFDTRQGGISDIFETGAGYHILQVTDRHEGKLTFGAAKRYIELYAMQEPLNLADMEARTQYPIVGVREPDLPPPPPPAATKPAATRPANRPTHRAVTPRPSPRNSSTTTRPRPAAPRAKPAAH